MSSINTTVASVQQPGSENPAMVQLAQLVKALDLSQEADKETSLKTGRLLGGIENMAAADREQNQILRQEVFDLKSALGQVFVLLKAEEAAHEQKEAGAQKENTDLREEIKILAEKVDGSISKQFFETFKTDALARITEAQDRAAAMQEANRALRQELDTRVGAAQTSMKEALQAERVKTTAQITDQVEAIRKECDGKIAVSTGSTASLDSQLHSLEYKVWHHFHFHVYGGPYREYGLYKNRPYHQDIVIDPDQYYS